MMGHKSAGAAPMRRVGGWLCSLVQRVGGCVCWNHLDKLHTPVFHILAWFVMIYIAMFVP